MQQFNFHFVENIVSFIWLFFIDSYRYFKVLALSTNSTFNKPEKESKSLENPKNTETIQSSI